MFYKIYTATLKSTLRSPATLLSLIPVVLMWICESYNRVGQVSDYRTMLKLIYNRTAFPIILVLPIFAAVVSSVGILQDKKNHFYDIEKTTAMKTYTYYIGKIVAFATICMLFLFLYITCSTTYSAFFGQAKQNLVSMGLAELLIRMFQTTLIMSIPSLLIYISIPIAMSLLTNSAICGIASSIVYCLMGMAFSELIGDGKNIFGNYIYPISEKIHQYMYYFNSEYASELGGKLSDVVLSYALTISMSILFFGVGYIALRRRAN